MDDLGVVALIVIAVVGVFITGFVAGARFERDDRARTACVETCAPQAALFSDGKCGCVR